MQKEEKSSEESEQAERLSIRCYGESGGAQWDLDAYGKASEVKKKILELLQENFSKGVERAYNKTSQVKDPCSHCGHSSDFHEGEQGAEYRLCHWEMCTCETFGEDRRNLDG